ncbi:MAG TPA: PAS domain-containing protein, partial [Burkholderiaceae bacterium]
MNLQALRRDPAIGWSVSTVALGVLAVLLVAWNVHREFGLQRAQAESRLQSVAELRASQVEDWVARKMSLAYFLDDSAPLADQFIKWREGDAGAGERLLKRAIDFRKADGDDDVLILDRQGKVLASERPDRPAVANELKAAIDSALTLGESTRTGIYESPEAESPLRMDIVIPLLKTGTQAQGFLALRVDVRRSLMPLLASWPVPSRSGQSNLWARNADRLVPIADDPAASALVSNPPPGHEGSEAPIATWLRERPSSGQAVRSIDRRGVDVLATARQVHGANWWLVSKLDVQEVDAPVWSAASWTLVVAACALLGLWLTGRLMLSRGLIARVARARAGDRKRLRTLGMLDLITRSSHDAIFAKDPQGRYLFCNRAAADWILKSPADVVGRTDFELFEPAIAERLTRNDAAAMAGSGPTVFEEEMPAPNGTQAMSICAKGPLRAPDGTLLGVFGIARDMAEAHRDERAQPPHAAPDAQPALEALERRHRESIDALAERTRELQVAEEALNGARRLNHAIAEIFPGRVAYWDGALCCRFANARYAAALGLPIDKVVDRPAGVIFGDAFTGELRPRLEAALAGEPQRFERRGPLGDGSIGAIDVRLLPERSAAGVRGVYELSLELAPPRPEAAVAAFAPGPGAPRVAGLAAPATQAGRATLKQRLSMIAGFDVSAGLRTVNGSEAALARVLRTFASTYRRGVADLLNTAPPDHLQRWRLTCHSLRG